jgi:hypothetical protein
VIELVLDDARPRPLELAAIVLAGHVLSDQQDRSRPLDGDVHALDGEATLVVGLPFLAAHLDPGIDDRGRLLVLGRLVDEQAPQHADLRRREPDTVRVAHQGGHPLDQAGEVLVEVLHLLGAHA